MTPRGYYATRTEYVEEPIVDDPWNVYRDLEREEDHDICISLRMTS